MQSPESQIIISRFFQALAKLKECGHIRGKKSFCDRYDINRRNFYQSEHNLASDRFQIAWIEHIVSDYPVSLQWIMCGNGKALIN